LHAWKYAKGLYLIPLFMVVHQEMILGGPLWLVLAEGAVVMIALTAFAAALEGYGLRPLSTGGRVLLMVAALSAYHPSLLVGGAGCAVALTYVLWDRRLSRSGGMRDPSPTSSGG
jgi:TRAP-type uncharacterized transport system fused permease subunit